MNNFTNFSSGLTELILKVESEVRIEFAVEILAVLEDILRDSSLSERNCLEYIRQYMLNEIRRDEKFYKHYVEKEGLDTDA